MTKLLAVLRRIGRLGRLQQLALALVLVGPTVGLVVALMVEGGVAAVAVLIALLIALPSLGILVVSSSPARSEAETQLGEIAGRIQLMERRLDQGVTTGDLDALHERFQLSHDALRLRYEIFAQGLLAGERGERRSED